VNRRFPIVTLRLDDPKRAGGPAFVVLSRYPDPSENRRRVPLTAEPVRFDLRADPETTYVVDVLDSELRHERIEVLEKNIPKDGVLQLTNANAIAPLVVTVPVCPGIERAQIWCELTDKRVVPLDRIEHYAFEIDEYGGWMVREPGVFALADAP